MTFPIDAVRYRFPALHIEDDGRRRIYFEAPGGTQVCSDAIEAMTANLVGGTANAGGRSRRRSRPMRSRWERTGRPPTC